MYKLRNYIGVFNGTNLIKILIFIYIFFSLVLVSNFVFIISLYLGLYILYLEVCVALNRLWSE